MILEAGFGWEWLCEELEQSGLEPHLAGSRKVMAWREARGMAKSNRTDADPSLRSRTSLLSELWSQTDPGGRCGCPRAKLAAAYKTFKADQAKAVEAKNLALLERIGS